MRTHVSSAAILDEPSFEINAWPDEAYLDPGYKRWH